MVPEVGREAVTNVEHVFRVLADAVLLAHFGVVVFVAGGLAAIVVGNRRSWRWVNRRWFRLSHLAAIGVVVAANWLGVACPLTTLESWLRRQAGSPPYAEGFVQHWVERWLYYQGDPWVFGAAYTVFGFLVVGAWWAFPPEQRRVSSRRGSGKPPGETPAENREAAPANSSSRRRRHLLGGFLLLLHGLGLLSSVDALMSTRTAPGAVAWIVSLNTFPYVAVPAYWVFGRSRFQGYVIGRREGESALHRAIGEKLDHLSSRGVTLPSPRSALLAIERLAKIPSVGHNRVELLIDGEAAFRSIFAGIEAAERYLLVQFYIVRYDALGRELKARLVAKARSGVAVHFLYDEIGSYRLPAGYIRELAEAGVRASPFHSTRGSGNRFQLNFRNHRKVVVADGRSGWVGGLNVGDEYLGRDPRVGDWRDTNLRLEGPAALALQLSFLEDWHWATGEILDLDWEPAAASGLVPVLVLPSGPADRFETASLMVQQAIHAASRRLWISSPYFVPDEGVLAALKLAAIRGVDVRVLIPERTDNLLTSLAAYAFIGPLLESGVQIYRYGAGFLHGKTWLIDDLASAVGTVNLDNRSFRLNFEITAWVLDPEFAGRMEQMFTADFERSRPMTETELARRSWWLRAASRAAYLFAPVL